MGTKKATTHQMWSRFDAIKTRFGPSSRFTELTNPANFLNPAPGRLEWISEITTLRQQLVARCRSIYGMQAVWNGKYWFVAPPKTSALGLKADQLNNVGAACKFMAWEVEQLAREKAQHNGN